MLPTHLAERTERTAPPVDGDFVLYWMRTAVRASENPALDVAITVGNALVKPVFVYHALSERYPFANDRHHTFILQAARDVQPRLQERGVATAFHLERPGHRGPHLKTLADRACLVVTEDMPVAPLTTWTQALRASTDTPVWSVDTACVVPMRLVGTAHTRAFQFRNAIQAHLDARIDRDWHDVAPTVPASLPALPFEPVDLASADIPALVATCDIDHSIGPIGHTRGGPGPGAERWQDFVRSGLSSYAKRRNHPLADGVSRMSAYLHYGMVSPMALAREANAAGADKYVDELVVWRELAYSFCKYGPDPTTTSALPEWARTTLQRHEGDPHSVLDWETLARGRTGDALWDTAQHSLLRNGELHNNVRMTWGKALVGWSRNAEHALDRLIDLNHRYALDGRDPASYGGLLWALGQFDRPFKPEQPVFGTVRTRSTDEHAKRLKVDVWAQSVAAPSIPNPPRIAVVGAGIAGAACARTLHDHGLDVVLYEASDRVGGRLGSVVIDGERLDVGAQHLTVRDPMLKRWMQAWCERGVAARWEGPFGTLTDGAFEAADLSPRYVGVPRMGALAAHLCRDLTLHLSTPIEALTHQGTWQVAGDAYDWVVLALPPGHPLVAAHGQATTKPVTTVAITLPGPTDWSFAEARLPDGPVERVVRDASRPGRPTGTRWMIASRPGFNGTAQDLVDAARDAFDLPEPSTVVSHTWDVGEATVDASDMCLVTPDQLVLCGSCMHPGRIENALLSGVAAAGRILGQLAAHH